MSNTGIVYNPTKTSNFTQVASAVSLNVDPLSAGVIRIPDSNPLSAANSWASLVLTDGAFHVYYFNTSVAAFANGVSYGTSSAGNLSGAFVVG